ncbi:MAG: cyclic nucleotide-binding domain-containing protein [Spirochaetes bacterium]|nr:cyclic nucleotide-binding domain-containing protein [Spirochaetota bacterium]
MTETDRELTGNLFASLVPFRFLATASMLRLVREISVRDFRAGETVIEQGASAPDSVFVLLAGSAESLDVSRTPAFRVNVIEAGAVFGERSCVLDMPQALRVSALDDARCIEIPGDSFRRLFSESPPFSQAFAQKLREGRGAFEAFDAFRNEVVRAVGLGHLEIRRLVELYKKLEPALHPHGNEDSVIDFGALDYAARRLPDNVERVFVFLLTDDLPVVYTSPDLLFPFVHSDSRNRFVYEMLEGKNMVLIRSGLSDLMDFVSCLCLFAVETRKIRYKLNHPDAVLALANRVRLDPAARGDDDAFMATLPFSEEERRGLKRVWPEGTVDRLRNVVFHRQVYSVDIRKQTNNYNGRLSERWTAQVGDAARVLLGVSPADFPEDFGVHIISSNTHSVSNCLNPFFPEHGAGILDWAEHEGIRTSGWTVGADELYHLSRGFFKAFPEQRRVFYDTEREWGIMRLPDTVTTGISVQLVDVSKVCMRPIDPGIRSGSCDARSLIVNIDYAFGEQAEEIMKNLLILFGRNVASINVLGKAGALTGRRGDVLLPGSFVEQVSDSFLPVAGVEDEEQVGRIEALLPGRTAHRGPMLTVEGTLLQNRPMLNFYRRLWGCIGLEMEGIWYLRAIIESEQLGVLKPGAARRFLYYVSDLPLDRSSNLSEPLSPAEGVPPLYAITREVLSGILGSGR